MFCLKRDKFVGSLSRIKNIVGQKFIIIIDEWDVLIRDEAANKKVQEKYINFLRAMFKGNGTDKIYSVGVSYRYFADKERKNAVCIK